jgi:hypothetical protein
MQLQPEIIGCSAPEGLTNYFDPWYWNMMKFKWNPVDDALAYRVRYKRTDEEDWNYKFSGAGKNHVVIQYWDCFVDYEVQVMAICSEDGAQHSAFSEPLIFNTGTMDHCLRTQDDRTGEMHVYPNPAIDLIYISIPDHATPAALRLLTLNGTLMAEQFIESDGNNR